MNNFMHDQFCLNQNIFNKQDTLFEHDLKSKHKLNSTLR